MKIEGPGVKRKQQGGTSATVASPKLVCAFVWIRGVIVTRNCSICCEDRTKPICLANASVLKQESLLYNKQSFLLNAPSVGTDNESRGRQPSRSLWYYRACSQHPNIMSKVDRAPKPRRREQSFASSLSFFSDRCSSRHSTSSRPRFRRTKLVHHDT